MASSAATVGEGVEQTVDGCHVPRNGALLDAAHKLLAVQRLSGELELLHVVVRRRRGLLVFHLHPTDPTSLVSDLNPAIRIRRKPGAPRLTFRRSLLSSGRLSASCLSSGRRDWTSHVTSPAGKTEVSIRCRFWKSIRASNRRERKRLTKPRKKKSLELKHGA